MAFPRHCYGLEEGSLIFFGRLHVHDLPRKKRVFEAPDMYSLAQKSG